MKFYRGDKVRLIEELDFTDITFKRGTPAQINKPCGDNDIFDYHVKFDSGRMIKVREREITHRYDPHNQLVYHQKREEWICPFCDSP